jgi:ComF family protein
VQRLGGALSVIGREAARLVLPSWCVACARELPWRDRTGSCCGDCWRSLPQISSAKCRSCALPLPGDGTARCLECQLDPLPLDWCDAWGIYRGTLERVLHAFKFGRHDFLDDPLGGLLASTLEARGDAAFDALVPVPMSRAKQRRRGYNQAETLARALSRRSGIPCDPALLLRRREGETQSQLPRDRRAANVRGAFRAGRGAAGKAILLVDDICTTGETLRACAKELLRGGASRVAAITLAKTV